MLLIAAAVFSLAFFKVFEAETMIAVIGGIVGSVFGARYFGDKG
jgi:hypothetical protein